MKVEIVSKESIRPSNPTPPHLKTFKLSLLDLHVTPFYTPIFLFYSNHTQSKPTERSCCLKRSLSQTLTKYYPFAGRYTDDESAIDCNDEGVEFWEAQIDCKMSDILKRPDSDDLNVLFPPGFMWKQSLEGSIVAIQVNFFDCGGMAVNVCMSHNIADGSSISTFLYDWATMACRSGKQVSPQFIDSSIISPNIVVSVVPKFELVESSNHVTRRFVFEAEKITELKAIVRDSKAEENPTRVQVVTALLYKCAIKASHANSGSLKNSRMCHLVNMRSRMDPPLPTNSVGNFVWYFMVSNNGKMLTLEELVDQLKNGMAKLCDKEKNNMKVNDWLLGVVKSWGEVNKIVDEDVETYRCSSFCRFPMYQVDFGWGKPMWVSCANPVVKNSFVLMDDQKGDGIEALVILDEQEMAIFQCDEELLTFASLKSNISQWCLNTNGV